MGVYSRVAKTRTEDTAWKLIEWLEAETVNKFVVVLRRPSDGFEIVPTGPMHRIDEAIAKSVIASFRQDHSG